MGTTKLQLYKRACVLMEQSPISALSDNVEVRRRLDDHYDDTLAWLMEQGFWRTGMRTVEITQNESVSPAFSFEFAHDMPSDFVKRYVVSASEFLDPPLDEQQSGNAYLMEGGYIWANVTPIYMRYLSNDSAYGLDLTLWTEGMANACAHELAARACPVTTGSTEKAGELHEKAVALASRAATFDAMQQPSQRHREGRWTGNRFTGRISDYRRGVMREKSYLFALNGGEVSPLALGRVDLSRMRISGETYLNVIPRVIGPIQARAGFAYLGTTDGSGIARNIPFIFSATDTAKVELSDQKIRVWVDDALISRNSVSTVVTNGDFDSSTGWTLTTTGTGVANINSTNAGALTLQTPAGETPLWPSVPTASLVETRTSNTG
jgi:hypothetical protein